jgi:hypothetical protein
MAILPNMALQRFEDYKDNLIVRELIRFITITLERPLESVISWGVEITEKPVRSFYVTFTDGVKMSGRLEEVWMIRVFDYEQEKA